MGEVREEEKEEEEENGDEKEEAGKGEREETHCRSDALVQVAVSEYDVWILPAQFQRDLLDPLGARGIDATTSHCPAYPLIWKKRMSS
jgi:hypothetical protein